MHLHICENKIFYLKWSTKFCTLEQSFIKKVVIVLLKQASQENGRKKSIIDLITC